MPAWLTVSVQLPAPVSVRIAGDVTGEIEQLPVTPSDTGNPTLDVAVIVGTVLPYVNGVPSAGAVNARTCAALAMANDCVTSTAANVLASPAWLAVMLQLPAPVSVTLAGEVEPDRVQFPVAASVTGSPDDAVAETAKGGSP